MGYSDGEQEVVLEVMELDTSDSTDNESGVSLQNNINIEYPCGIISGITTEYEVEFLKGLQCDEATSLPLYINFEGLVLPMGRISLTMDYLLMLRTLDVGHEYSLEVCKSSDHRNKINLNDPNTLMKFMKL